MRDGQWTVCHSPTEVYCCCCCWTIVVPMTRHSTSLAHCFDLSPRLICCRCCCCYCGWGRMLVAKQARIAPFATARSPNPSDIVCIAPSAAVGRPVCQETRPVARQQPEETYSVVRCCGHCCCCKCSSVPMSLDRSDAIARHRQWGTMGVTQTPPHWNWPDWTRPSDIALEVVVSACCCCY